MYDERRFKGVPMVFQAIFMDIWESVFIEYFKKFQSVILLLHGGHCNYPHKRGGSLFRGMGWQVAIVTSLAKLAKRTCKNSKKVEFSILANL